MRNNPKGFSNLVLILVISGTLLTLGIFLNQRIRNNWTMQDQAVARNQAGISAQTCLYEAYLRLARNRGYTNGQLNEAPIFCTMSIASQGTTYTITSIGTSGTYSRTLSLTLSDTSGTLTPTHFTELP